MGCISLNGAVFIFLQKGEKLKENEGLPRNGYPDRRYVIWPRANCWDVRVKVYQNGNFSWEPITESVFESEESAWQTGFNHLLENPTLGVSHNKALFYES